MSFNFKFTVEQLKEIIGRNPYVEFWYSSICEICPEYGINTPKRLAAFLSQCAHESANFTKIRENLNYSAKSLMKTWPSRFTTIEIANQYARNPEKLANKVYSNRNGNGDEESGDGWKYIGRGLIQLTGKENYMWFSKSIGISVEQMPDYLSTFEGAVQSACFFWEINNLNELADNRDTLKLTKRINGGTTGLADREKKYAIACRALGA